MELSLEEIEEILDAELADRMRAGPGQIMAEIVIKQLKKRVSALAERKLDEMAGDLEAREIHEGERGFSDDDLPY